MGRGNTSSTKTFFVSIFGLSKDEAKHYFIVNDKDKEIDRCNTLSGYITKITFKKVFNKKAEIEQWKFWLTIRDIEQGEKVQYTISSGMTSIGRDILNRLCGVEKFEKLKFTLYTSEGDNGIIWKNISIRNAVNPDDDDVKPIWDYFAKEDINNKRFSMKNAAGKHEKWDWTEANEYLINQAMNIIVPKLKDAAKVGETPDTIDKGNDDDLNLKKELDPNDEAEKFIKEAIEKKGKKAEVDNETGKDMPPPTAEDDLPF